MLQNRVDPFGTIIKTPGRGTLMGNRGVIHDHEQQIVRPFKLKAWITCVLQFKGRHRVVMTPGRWTELFFMDEATAFSAGHRPCAECRREDFNRFKEYWLLGNPEAGFDLKTPIAKIDEILHGERMHKDKRKKTFYAVPASLPDGAMVAMGGRPFLKWGALLQEWSPGGYLDALPMPGAEVEVLTPKSIVNAFRAGYLPQIRSKPTIFHP